MKKEYHKNTQKKPISVQDKKKIQNEIYTWIIFAMIVFWTVSSILGIIGFTRSFNTNTATAETVAVPVVEEPKQDSVSKMAVQGNRTKKIAKLNELPPSSSNSIPKIPSMYGFDVSIEHYDMEEGSRYETAYSFPLEYDSGFGDRVFEYDDYVPVYMSVSPTSTIYTRFDYRQGFANTDLSTFDIKAKWTLGTTFVNELWYEHFFGGFSLSLGGATNYNFYPMDYYSVITVLVPNDEKGTLETKEIVYEGTSSGNHRFLEFNAPTWNEFYAMYGYEGYCVIDDMFITFTVHTPLFQDYISFTLNHLSSPREYREFITLQSNGAKAFYNRAYTTGVINANDYSFLSLLASAVDAPFKVLYDLFNFEIFGYNLTNFFLALLSACVVLAVLKVILGR